jgi:hypothetical protein
MAQKKVPSKDNKPEQFIFGRKNYTLMFVSFAVVTLGFILMTGKTDIYNFQKIVLAPILVLTGFGIGFFAILKKPDQD